MGSIDHLKPAPKKQPKKPYSQRDGSCVQCGFCCYGFWCVAGSAMHGSPRDEDPCPELLCDDNGKFYCNLLLTLPEGSMKEKLKLTLSVGKGCGHCSMEYITAVVTGTWKGIID